MNTSNPKPFQNKLTVISGASSGFGRATAIKFAEAGSDLVILARRKDRLDELKEQCKDVNVYPVAVDLSDPNSIQEALNQIPQKYRAPDFLINNAGTVRGMAKVWETTPKDWDEMIDVNLKGVLYLTRFFLSEMVKNQKGHIINVGSTSSHYTYPGGGVYCATKYAIKALTDTLRMELVDSPVRVSMISPGMAETEFSEVRFHGDTGKAKDVYKGITPLTAQDIAETIYFIATRPPHVNIADIIIFPKQQASPQIVSRRQG